MTEPQEFSSDFDRWVCSLLDMLRAKGYTNVSVNRGRDKYIFTFKKETTISAMSNIGGQGRFTSIIKGEKRIPKTTLDEHYANKQTPQQILDLI